jgi:copper transport protein
VRRVLVATVLAIGTLVWFAPAAGAHAALVDSTPSDGAVLANAPAQITMTFSQPPDPALSVAHLLNAQGTQVESGTVKAGASDTELVLAIPSDLPDGIYTVTWQVTSADDGHVTANYFSFGIGEAPNPGAVPATPVATTPPPSPLSVIGKFLLYAGLALVVGAAATGLWAFGGHVPARRFLLSLAGAAAFVGTLLMVAAERATVSVSIGTLLGSQTGRPLIWMLAGGAATLAACLVASRTISRATLVVAGVAAAATMLIRALGGHADNADPVWFEVSAQWIHFMAVGVWIGGLVPILLLLRERRDAEPPAAEVRRYSFMAGIALAVVLVTGFLRMVSELGGLAKVAAIFSTSYGTTLAIKIAVVLGLIALGAWNRYRSVPRVGEDAGMLRRVMTVEVAVAVGVFALTGVLTGLPPNPPATPASQAPQSVSAAGSDFATTIKVTLTATPGTPGPNTFDVGVRDYDTGAPADATAVSLHFALQGQPDVGGGQLDLKAGVAGDWSAQSTDLSLAGTWNVNVLVQRGASATEIPLNLTTRSPPQQLVVTPPQNGLPALYTITVAGGDQLQAYNDPGAAGTNQLHLTAFDDTGSELPLKSASITATPPGGTAEQLKTQRFGAGHFVASVNLTAGEWHFDLEATAKDGTGLQGYFDQTIG